MGNNFHSSDSLNRSKQASLTRVWDEYSERDFNIIMKLWALIHLLRHGPQVFLFLFQKFVS